MHRQPEEIDPWNGGRGIYFEDPAATIWKSSRAATAVGDAAF